LPKIGSIQVQDAETGQMILINTNDNLTQYNYHKQYKQIQEEAIQNFRMAGADLIQLATGDDYVKALQKFFTKRA
jgi:hypothetical protein